MSFITIPASELRFKYGTSSGPGGQHVNKVATKATLLFDVLNSPSLTKSQRNRILIELATRINNDGILRVSSSRHRSQKANREAARDRFFALINDVLKPRKRRKKSGIPMSQKRKRLENKKKRSEKKRLRVRVQPDHH